MPLAFTGWDWAVLGGYVAALALAGWLASRRRIASAEGYFLAGHHAPTWLVTISVLSTTQSAATFLGVPDHAYRGDWSYLGANIGAIIAAFIVATVLIPRFYALGVTTVYELLAARYSAMACRAAAAMYLVGRVLASGARLYLAAIAVSMIIFLDVEPDHIAISIGVLVLFGIAFTLFGGLNAVIWSDLVQVVLYVGAAILVLVLLLSSITAPPAEVIAALTGAEGGSKLSLIDTSLDFSAPFSLFAILTGIVLLNIGNAGLDQDTTQRFLACENAREGQRALYASAIATIPVVAIFMAIGTLLWLFFERPELMGGGGDAVRQAFAGEKITVFMSYILSEVPPGLRGLVTVGVIAAAAINSGLISMSAVLVSDFYRPWRGDRGFDEAHYVRVGRWAVVVLALVLFAVAIFCFHWQRATETPLLEFVLGVMAFAYSGLLGVFATAVFTRRGTTASIIAALIAGFLTTLAMQPYVAAAIGLPPAFGQLAFPWQLVIGTAVAFAVAAAPRGTAREEKGRPKRPFPSAASA